MITLYIAEEFGFRHWVARLTNDEYRDLIRRWETMRGLSCLVPVTRIIPQATQLDTNEVQGLKPDIRCHIHECDDSYLDGSSYKIPQDDRFWIEGVASNPLVDIGGDCPDIQISSAVSNEDLETLLTEVIASGKVAVIAEDEDPALDCSTLAIAIREADPDWPVRLRFTYLDMAHKLGEQAHLTIAKHLSERLSSRTCSEGGVFPS